MHLSANLSLGECTRSDIAARAGLDNTPPLDAIKNLRRLAVTVFEPMRAQFGPLFVSSGYRSPELNLLVPGSAASSAHCFGCALDLRPLSRTVRLRDMIAWLAAGPIPFDQAIYEFGAWIHVGIEKPPHAGPRRMVLMKFAGEPYRVFDGRDKRTHA